MKRLLALLLAGCCAAGLAQTPMYRSTMPDGKKVISDRPVPGATKVEEITSSKGNYAPGSPPKASPGSQLGGDRNAAREAADARVRSAQQAYDNAAAAAAKGKEEVEGDRIGTAKGGARLSEAYDRRQQALQAQVESAARQLDEARRSYNAVR